VVPVVIEAGDGEEAVELARPPAPRRRADGHPDAAARRGGGSAADRRGGSARPGAGTTTFDLDEYVVGALRARAGGFVPKDVPADELVAAIRVAAGEAVVAPRVLRRRLDRYAGHPRDPAATTPAVQGLTDREHEVLVLIARGLSNAEIARALVVSETTVKTHVGHVLTELGVRDRVQAVVLAYGSGLVRPGG
jgi:DNA-binding NarL/FixJ family response regulator